MSDTTLQAMNAVGQVLEGLSMDEKLHVLGTVSVLAIANQQVPDRDKIELSKKFVFCFLDVFSDLVDLGGINARR